MSDFLSWLYPRYIKPYLEERQDGSPYQMSLALLEDSLAPDQKGDYARAMEFCAVHAFVLGMRTGQGLADAQ